MSFSKGFIFFLFAGASALLNPLASQTPEEVAAFNRENLYGSPRYVGMGGAFTSLGSDLSGITLNPAGISVFKYNQIDANLDVSLNRDQLGPFYGRQQNENSSRTSLGNLGLAVPFQAGEGKLQNWGFGVSYQRQGNFNRNYRIQGNRENDFTMGEFWGESSANLNIEAISDDAFAAWQAYLLVDTVTPGDETFIRDSTASYAYGDFNQGAGTVNSSSIVDYELNQFGSSSTLDFAFGGNYQEKLYYGLSLNFPRLNFTREEYITEFIQQQDAAPYNATQYTYRRRSDLSGTGFNLKLGLIYVPVPEFRIGASYQSPTWYSIDQTYEFEIQGQFNAPPFSGVETNTTSDIFSTNQYTYALRRPAVYRVGISSLIANQLLFSLDYRYSQPAQNDLREGNDDLSLAPDVLEDSYQSGIDGLFRPSRNTLAAGLEWRIKKRYFIRAGLRQMESLYRQEEEDRTAGSIFTYTGGLGAQFDQLGLNLGFALSRQDVEYVTYAGQDVKTGENVEVLQPLETKRQWIQITGGISYRF